MTRRPRLDGPALLFGVALLAIVAGEVAIAVWGVLHRRPCGEYIAPVPPELRPVWPPVGGF